MPQFYTEKQIKNLFDKQNTITPPQQITIYCFKESKENKDQYILLKKFTSSNKIGQNIKCFDYFDKLKLENNGKIISNFKQIFFATNDCQLKELSKGFYEGKCNFHVHKSDFLYETLYKNKLKSLDFELNEAKYNYAHNKFIINICDLEYWDESVNFYN